MKETNFIDNDTKVLDFMAMTETGDPEVARKYLENNKWDVTSAVNAFFGQINVNNNIDNNNVINIPKNEININDNNIINNNLNNNNQPNNNPPNPPENQSFISRYIFGPIAGFFNAIIGTCKERREIDLDEEERIFHFLPNKIHDSYKFCKFITKKIGIIIFYTGNDVHFFTDFVSLVSRNSMMMNLLRQNFVIYPLLANSNEGYKMQNAISDSQLKLPSLIFCFNSSYNHNNNGYENYIFSRTFIINTLEEKKMTIENFNKALIDCTEQFGIAKVTNEFDIGPIMSDGEILQKQKDEMEALEKQAQMKEEEMKRKKLQEQKEKLEEEEKIKKIEIKASEAKQKIVEEPSEDDPNVTTICFRYPDGEKRKDRRFLKSHTIQNLYDYVTSLGNEIYSEEGNNSFSLYQPFPPKKYDIMENTLEKEGLFPNAVIQIREEE